MTDQHSLSEVEAMFPDPCEDETAETVEAVLRGMMHDHERSALGRECESCAHYLDVLLAKTRASERAQVAALVAAAEAAKEHTDELEDAWARGCISEHDGKGGTRSNRNVTVNRALRAALASLSREPVQ